MAVVAVGPFAMGVRYSVCVVRRRVDGDGDRAGEGFDPPCLDFANFASLEAGRSPEELGALSGAV